LILLSVILALVLAVAHLPFGLPAWTDWLRPGWVVMVVFFWAMELPQRFGLISAWLIGLGVDVCLGDPLGVNGFCLATLTFATWSLYERFRMYSSVQQGIVIFIMVLFTSFVRLITHIILGEADFTWAFLLPALVSMLLWPLLVIPLRRASRSVVTV